MEGYAGNYTGPYWSDGKLQESVEFGELDPQSELDYLSYQHDTAYAHYKDKAHREAADQIYNARAKQLAGQFPGIAGGIVEYGNMGQRQTSKFLDRIGTGFKYGGPLGALGGAIYFQGENMIESNKRMKGTYLQKEKQEIEKLYAQDPKKDWAEKKGYSWKPKAENNRAERAPTNAGQTRAEHTTTTKLDKPSLLDKVKKVASQLTKERNRKSQSARVQPEETVSHQALIDSQRRRLVNYRQLHAAAVHPNPGGTKKKKKKGNVRRAVVIDPYLHLR
jgi:hypothetical protein